MNDVRSQHGLATVQHFNDFVELWRATQLQDVQRYADLPGCHRDCARRGHRVFRECNGHGPIIVSDYEAKRGIADGYYEQPFRRTYRAPTKFVDRFAEVGSTGTQLVALQTVSPTC